MSATPCLNYVVPRAGDEGRCWACGGSRAEHVGRTPPAPSRLPTPEEAVCSLLSKQYDTEETAVHALEEDRERILARLDAIDALLGLDGRHYATRGAP